MESCNSAVANLFAGCTDTGSSKCLDVLLYVLHFGCDRKEL